MLGAGAAVETLRTNSDKGKTAINLTGNELDQTIIGNLGANRIDGKGGIDSLFGKAGADTFIFSTAPGPGNVDTIQDYNALYDTIALDDAIFGGTVGALAAGAFALGTAASQLDDRVIYDPASHKLYYDADGSGAGAAIHFATLNGSNLNSARGFVSYERLPCWRAGGTRRQGPIDQDSSGDQRNRHPINFTASEAARRGDGVGVRWAASLAKGGGRVCESTTDGSPSRPPSDRCLRAQGDRHGTVRRAR